MNTLDLRSGTSVPEDAEKTFNPENYLDVVRKKIQEILEDENYLTYEPSEVILVLEGQLFKGDFHIGKPSDSFLAKHQKLDSYSTEGFQAFLVVKEKPKKRRGKVAKHDREPIEVTVAREHEERLEKEKKEAEKAKKLAAKQAEQAQKEKARADRKAAKEAEDKLKAEKRAKRQAAKEAEDKLKAQKRAEVEKAQRACEAQKAKLALLKEPQKSLVAPNKAQQQSGTAGNKVWNHQVPSKNKCKAKEEKEQAEKIEEQKTLAMEECLPLIKDVLTRLLDLPGYESASDIMSVVNGQMFIGYDHMGLVSERVLQRYKLIRFSKEERESLKIKDIKFYKRLGMEEPKEPQRRVWNPAGVISI